MIWRGTTLPGVLVQQPEPHRDDRGSFARLFAPEDFAAAGLDFRPLNISLSENTRRATLRGMHWQAAPAAEQKLVRCIRGAIFDVVVDLRADSPTRLRWLGMTLTAAAGHALFVPRGCAHGFLTLHPDSAVEYWMDAPHVPELARGLRWNDPRIGIAWPLPPRVMSDRDRHWPDHAG